MPRAVVIDLSHHNTIPESLQAAADAGIMGVIHKATEGTSYIDSKVQARYRLAKDAGMLWGIYHFLRPGSMDLQAANFVDQARALGVLDADTLVAADHEDAGVSLDDLVDFLAVVADMTKRAPVIYSGHVLKDQLKGEADYRLNQYRLWLAQYTSGTPTVPPGWPHYWLWQYTDKGSVPGVNPPTDLNDYIGGELAREWSGSTGPTPQPTERPTVTVIVKGDVEVKVVYE